MLDVRQRVRPAAPVGPFRGLLHREAEGWPMMKPERIATDRSCSRPPDIKQQCNNKWNGRVKPGHSIHEGDRNTR
jgi:hypothetical protein